MSSYEIRSFTDNKIKAIQNDDHDDSVEIILAEILFEKEVDVVVT